LALTRVVSPIARVLAAPWKWMLGLARGEEIPSPWSTGDEYFAASASDEEQVRDRIEEALLEAVSEFGEKVVREVMVPRTDMAALEDTESVAEAVQVIRATGYSRLPVYHDTVDDVRGVLYAKDLLTALERGGDVQIARIARQPYFVPETKPVDQLLVDMRSSRTHIAIVADEYGGTSGLVTIEDLLEEIVGEIFDEYDLEVTMLEELGADRVRVDARMPLDDLNERFGTAIELENADTVGGLVITLAGRIPQEGESVEIEGLKLTAESLEGTRILHVTVQPAAPPAEEGSDDA
ncbi:MAG: HlyC/CorC family transporter, partial [Coriobacteriales bacterium]|nr:HlyC/CorC family transporter [Coriobacteriales bacterium]